MEGKKHYWIENNIIETEPDNFDYHRLGGLGNVIFQNMQKHGEKIAQIEVSTGRRESYESLLLRSVRTALTLKKNGIKKGDIITSCSELNLNACVPTLASLLIGAIPCNLDPTLTGAEFNLLIAQVKPIIVFTVPSCLNIIEDALRNNKLDTKVVVFGESDRHVTFDSYLEPQEEERDFKPIIVKDPKETCLVSFSSGTSGFPKAICLNHYWLFCSSLISVPQRNNDLDKGRPLIEVNKREENSYSLCFNPMYWGTAVKTLFMSSITGSTRLLFTNFSPKQFWLSVHQYKISAAFLNPFDIMDLVKYGKPVDVDTTSLVTILSGGASLSKKYYLALQEIIPEVKIVPTYSQTETGPLVGFHFYNTMPKEFHRKNPTAVGLPVRGVRYKVVDPDTDRILGPNEEGELCVKSFSVMNGYFNQDCSDRFDKDGWLKTGDVVKYDDNFLFYVVDKVKEIIRSREWDISPAILELELSQHPAVRQSVVIGKPHELDGEHPVAIIVLDEKAKDTTADQIMKFLEERVPGRLIGGVKFVDKIPMTPSRKAKRRELKRMILEGEI